MIDIDHRRAVPQELQEMALADLPLEVLPSILPSRYCQLAMPQYCEHLPSTMGTEPAPTAA